MRPVSAFRHLMSSSVSVAAKTGQDGFGKPTYSAPVSYAAHISRKPQMALTAQGQQVLSSQSIYLATVDPILPTAQVTLSTGDTSSTEATIVHPLIHAVERLFDQAGPHHTVIRCA